jgi:hypothetical protein
MAAHCTDERLISFDLIKPNPDQQNTRQKKPAIQGGLHNLNS